MRRLYDYTLHCIKLDEQGNKTHCIIKTSTKEWTVEIQQVIDLINSGKKIKNASINNNELYLIPNDIKFKSLINQTFGEWTVLEYLGNKYWRCKCSCNKIKAVYTQSLLKGQSTSCGHTVHNFIDISGQIFGTWKVLNYLGNSYWNCKCLCGCETIKPVHSDNLRNGKSTSCGLNKNTFIDLTGQTFGDWTVIDYAGDSKWNCVCSCNPDKIHQISSFSLRNGKSKSCGHNTNAFINLTSQVFDKYTVISYAGNDLWNCICECGNEELVFGTNLRSGQSKSCGHCNRPKRKAWQINATRNETLFKTILIDASKAIKSRPTLREICEIFDISMSYAVYLIDKYNARYYIQYLNGTSYAEQDIADYLDSFNIKYKQRDRTILNNQELDFYIPDKHIAIEFNGTYWHSSLAKSYKYHQEKTLSCLEKNINLIHIFDYEWVKPEIQNKIKSLLKSLLNIGQTVIYAKDTQVQEVSSTEYKQFLNKYHLQNSILGHTALGLYYNNELVELMLFGISRFNTEYDTELLRLCTKSNYKIIGGASKLFKHYIKEHPTESIISYCSLSKFTGKVYKQIGMTLDTITSPGYVYVNRSNLEILSRYQCTKAELVSKGYGTFNQTEEEIMFNRNYLKVYDSGNARYVYKPSIN